jgi:hypothetical protein
VPTADPTRTVTAAWLRGWFGDLEDLLPVTHSLEQGIASWRCTVPADQDLVAKRVAVGIAARRLALRPDVFARWLGATSGALPGPVTEAEANQMLHRGLLVDIGTAAAPASDDAFYGMLAEAILHEFLGTLDHGLGELELLEGHDWTSLDKGGDKLAIYQAGGSRSFRLWESKARWSLTKPAHATVKNAADQIDLHAISYIGRFTAVASRTTEADLADFIARLPDLWADRDPCSGVGVSVTTHTVPTTHRPFGQLTTHFDLPDANKTGQLVLLGDLTTFRASVSKAIWDGMS